MRDGGGPEFSHRKAYLVMVGLALLLLGLVALVGSGPPRGRPDWPGARDCRRYDDAEVCIQDLRRGPGPRRFEAEPRPPPPDVP